MILSLRRSPFAACFPLKNNARRTSLACASILFALTVGWVGACGQAGQPLPYTMTTLAGSAPMSSMTGTQCPGLPVGVKSTDSFGDGCLAVNAVFGTAARGGVQVDSFGNVFVDDDVNSIVHVIDQTSGVMSVLAGGASSICSAATGVGAAGAVDTAGDGCLAATQTKTSSQRGIGLDPYGNVLLAGYGDNALHLICRNASPNCSAAQIGTMQLVAGCAKNAASGLTGGVGSDNVKAAQTFVTAGCTAANGEVSAPRGASGDQYGNVYFADTGTSRTRVVLGPFTSSYFAGNNPLYAALGVYFATPIAGYVYSVVNPSGTGLTTGGAATVKGAACSVTTNGVTYSGTALDALGDGCPFSSSSVMASSGFTSGVAVDAAGNMLFTDPTHGLRVLYVSGAGTAGAQMNAAIVANNVGITPQPGFIYLLWGGGATALSAAPTLGTATAASDSTITKVAVSPQGNIYVGDYNRVVSFDIATGYVRQLFASSANVAAGSFCAGSSGPKSLSAYSDGCPANGSVFANSSGLGLALDGMNNMYLFDASSTTKMLVRKVLAQGFAPETLSSAQAQTFAVHVPETGPATLSLMVALSADPEMIVGAASCNAQNGDYSFDCFATVTATPAAAGLRSATLWFTAAGMAPLDVSLSGVAAGSVLAFDGGSVSAGGSSTALVPATSAVFASVSAAGAAVDGAGNVYTMDTRSGQFLESVGGVSVALPGALPLNPMQIAVDALGDVFAVGSGSSSIVELAVSGPAAAGALSYAATSLGYTPVSGTAAPQAVAVDRAGNVFVADKQGSSANTAVYRLSLTKGTLEPQVMVAAGFSNPVSLAVDASGNVYVADSGAGAVLKLTPGLNNGVPGYVQSTVGGLTGVVPVAVATDAAGDLYVQDQASLSVIEVPVSGSNVTVLGGLGRPSGLAVDGRGVVYSADTGASRITVVARGAVAYNFGTSQAGTFSGTLTDVGNLAVTGQNPVTNTTNFNVVGGASNGCSFTSSVLLAQAAGNACTLSASFIGAGSGTVSDVLSYLPEATTLGSLTLSGTLQGTAVATMTTIGALVPANPAYVAAGTELTFTVTVAASAGTPGGTVAVTVDSVTANYPLVAGVATVALSGLKAGGHTIYAAYATSGSYTASNSGSPHAFSIAQDSSALAWAPAVSARQYSAPVGTAVLNATASFGGAVVPGVFVYTANGVEINAASYLAIGSYALAAMFVPSDATDFAGGTVLGGTLTVTQASTTAALGATQMLVAADGTGNYSSLQSAINALPGTGGSVYVKPGTYTGFVTVVQPNVSLYGLGGNPTNVVVTNEDGAFSPPFLAGQGYGNNGSAGDQGSATMVVARGTVNGVTATPSNFYAEDLTIANTYDTSTTTTSTNALVSGTCTANQPAVTLAALYNAGTECNSQALAIWITSDQAVLNNVYTTSQQDTIYAGSISGGSAYAARQYWFRGKVTGDVDYIFGDAAAVFDRTSIYTTFHGSVTGTETIEAQNQADQTGASPSYLSGYIMNSDVFTSQAAGMTNLYLGRPYGRYSTWIMLNSLIDQVNPLGYTEFQGLMNLPTSTYAEYNDTGYTDPATGAPDLNGVVYLGAGGSSGAGVMGVRESTSQDPGTPEAANAVKTTLTQAQAQPYYPLAFLGQTVPLSPYNSVTNWDPTSAIASGANSFVPASGASTVMAGTSVTLLMRPQTPGLGAVTYGVYTVPTGSYTLTDSFNGSSSVLAAGSLDAAGEATLTTNSLAAGTHLLSWTYGGDRNFAGSTTPAALSLTVTPAVSAAVDLIATSVLTRLADGSYQATISVMNAGTATVPAVMLTGVAIGSVSGTPANAVLGAILPGATASAVVAIPAAAGNSGTRAVEKITGTYTGGTFGGSYRLTLP